MYKVKTSENNGVTLQIANKDLNFMLIGGLSALLSLLDSLRLQSILVNNYELHIIVIVIAMVYVMYTCIVSLLIIGMRKLFVPSKIDIIDDKVVLKSCLFTLKADIREFIITDDDAAKNEDLMRNYKVVKPAIITLQRNDGNLSIPIDASELSKLSYTQ